jgi:hypothetical protein
LEKHRYGGQDGEERTVRFAFGSAAGKERHPAVVSGTGLDGDYPVYR